MLEFMYNTGPNDSRSRFVPERHITSQVHAPPGRLRERASSSGETGERSVPSLPPTASTEDIMSSRKVMAIQARKRRPKGKKDKTTHHRR
ncbi:hypothetical protein KOW79_012106 [Hemibagrus wyckioides]|uniref:Uncharacterized protein n=1 Tax=Hemibagrus wyckioides TaxID=337641 RepID=A0A9D3NN93_9TELE|nr:hypothetical protein KOW79_012106 [Hemibagrus wyckioides]